jgi:hypothetical protein
MGVTEWNEPRIGSEFLGAGMKIDAGGSMEPIMLEKRLLMGFALLEAGLCDGVDSVGLGFGHRQAPNRDSPPNQRAKRGGCAVGHFAISKKRRHARLRYLETAEAGILPRI